MDKPFTLFDIWKYQQELKAATKGAATNDFTPARRAVDNILAYSRALDVFNCRNTGSAYLLMN